MSAVFVDDPRPRVVCGQCGNTKAEAKVNGWAHQHTWVKYQPQKTEEATR